MGYPSDENAKNMICEYGRRLYLRGLVAGNEGNISCKTGEFEAWVTPTMESKGHMSPEMLVKLNLDGEQLEGDHSASSETKMHLGLYGACGDIMAVVHAHPPVATAFACRGVNVPTASLAEAVLFFGREIIVTPFAMLGTEDVPESVIPHIKGRRAVLLANHGALTWAKTLKEAVFLMETLEQVCKVFLISEGFPGGVNHIPEKDVELLLKLHDETVK